MSDSRAIAAVTAALTALVQSRIDRDNISPHPVVAPGALADDGDRPRVGVCLYRVTTNCARGNADLPTRTSTGELRRRPVAALDLHYLFTFRGTDPYQADRLLAVTAAALHAVPVLPTDLIRYAAARYPDVAGSDLADADEPVRITPETLSIDEVGRLWALYPPGAYTVTLAVAAGPVLVESVETPGTALPVRRVAVAARPLAVPRLDSVAGPDGPGAPVRAADPMPALDLYGAALSARPGETLSVRLDGGPAAAPEVVDDRHLRVALAGMGPGTHRVRVDRAGAPVDVAASGTSGVASSEFVIFTVVPAVLDATADTGPGSGPGERSGTVEVTVAPPLAAPQRARLLLDSLALEPPVALGLELDLPPAGEPAGVVTAELVDAPAGRYRVTLEVDRVRSLPALDAQGRPILPTVTL